MAAQDGEPNARRSKNRKQLLFEFDMQVRLSSFCARHSANDMHSEIHTKLDNLRRTTSLETHTHQA